MGMVLFECKPIIRLMIWTMGVCNLQKGYPNFDVLYISASDTKSDIFNR